MPVLCGVYVSGVCLESRLHYPDATIENARTLASVRLGNRECGWTPS